MAPRGAPVLVHDVLGEVRAGQDFRRVLADGNATQLVAMALTPGESLGVERHDGVEQVFLVLEGDGIARLGDSPSKARRLSPGDGLIVPGGTRHDIKAGPAGMRLLTLYAPPRHPPGTRHRTRDDAVIGEADRHIGKALVHFLRGMRSDQ